MKIKRKNWAKSVIARYWAEWEIENKKVQPWSVCGFDWGEPSCMACNWFREEWDNPKTVAARWNSSTLNKCHVVPLYLGGLDDPSNMVLMCDVCHAGQPDSVDPQVTYDYMNQINDWFIPYFEQMKRRASA